MDKVTGQRIVLDTFKASFDSGRYSEVIGELWRSEPFVATTAPRP